MDNNTKETLINLVSWYDSVNEVGKITIDDLARLNSVVETARDILDKGQTTASAAEFYEQYWLDFGYEIDRIECAPIKNENDC